MILSIFVISLKKPGAALGLLLVMFGLEQFLQTRDAFFVTRGNLVNLSIVITTALAAGFWMIRNLDKLVFTPVHAAALMLIALAFVSQTWTLAPREFDQYFNTAIPYFIVYLLIAPAIASVKTGIKTGIWTALYLGIPLVFMFVFVVEWESRGIRMATAVMRRGKPTYYTLPLALASMSSTVGLLAIILMPKNVLLKLLHFTTFALAAYITYRTQSRGQLLAMAVVALTCYPLANQATRIKGLLITLAGFVTIMLGLYLVFSFFDLGTTNRWNEASLRGGIDSRMNMVSTLLSAWANGQPNEILFGLGALSSFRVSGFYVHNLPAEILGEYGIIGACLFGFIYFQVARRSIEILRKLQHYPDLRREVVAVIAFFLFTTILSLKQGSLYSWPHLFFYAIAISILERHSRKLSSNKNWWKNMFLVAPTPGNFANQKP